ncbi:MAG: putative DNA-binding domain-containing protein [Myxococcales bacterium]|nr:putative DNA-binding domain-containing protein [Myxococcales bacterium]
MSVALADFFAQMQPFLTGAQDLARTREALGPSPSGDDDFAFYRVLAERNLFKIMRELYGPLRTLVLRDDPERWAPLVRAYARAHPPGGHHPNCFGEALSDFLAAQREQQPEQPVLYEELADFLWIRQAVYAAPDGEGDGFDRRLFVRQYTHRVHDLAVALERDPQAPVPAPQPMLLLVYRHFRSLQTRLFQPSAAGLVALARRQGAPVPEPLQAIPADHVEQAAAQLVAHRVLAPPPSPAPPRP